MFSRVRVGNHIVGVVGSRFMHSGFRQGSS
jgi:hypothetical protein